MLILGIESSCDETSASVVEKNDGGFVIKSNIIASQVETHKLYGGVVPEIASRAHIEAISRITYEALLVANVKIEDIDAVAVTTNPGLIGALLVGVNFAKALALAHGKPLIPVDHIKGHIASAYLIEGDVPKPPFIALAASGGHTAIYEVKDYSSIYQIGSTRDDAIGESFDKIGRVIGIPYPAGAGFDALAQSGLDLATGKAGASFLDYKKSGALKDTELMLPSPALRDETLDFSFSGLKTAAINLIHKYEQREKPLPRELFAARYTYEAVSAVVKKLHQALREHEGYDLVITGGVAANSHLRREAAVMAGELSRRIYIPPKNLCGDNGAMIAAEGYYAYKNGKIADSSLNASALDSIEIKQN